MTFNEEKTTQLCGYFLRKAGGRMPYIKALKLLYYVDRHFLVTNGYPVTGDSHYVMKNGPILSKTMDLMREEPSPTEKSSWGALLRTENYDLIVKSDIPDDLLSEADIEIMESLWASYGPMDKWSVVQATHQLPEVPTISEGRVSLPAWEIFEAAGFSRETALIRQREITGLAN